MTNFNPHFTPPSSLYTSRRKTRRKEWCGEEKTCKCQGYSELESVKEYPLQTDLSEENWTCLPFKDDMLIHVKKGF